MIDKNSVLKFAPHVIKRFEPKLERCYLLNFENDEIWVGNSSINIILAQLDGSNSVEKIIKDVSLLFEDFSKDNIMDATLPILQELVEKQFLVC